MALNVQENGKHKVYFVLLATVARQGPGGRQPLRQEGAFVFEYEAFNVAAGARFY